jgi:hypothetical protein
MALKWQLSYFVTDIGIYYVVFLHLWKYILGTKFTYRMIYYIILNCLSNYISRNGNYYGTKINNHLLCIISMCMDNHYYFYIIFVNPLKPEKNTFYFSYLYEKLGSSHILYVILLCLMYIAIYNILYYI